MTRSWNFWLIRDRDEDRVQGEIEQTPEILFLMLKEFMRATVVSFSVRLA